MREKSDGGTPASGIYPSTLAAIARLRLNRGSLSQRFERESRPEELLVIA